MTAPPLSKAGGARDLSPELRDAALAILRRWERDDDYPLGELLDDLDGLLGARRQGALTEDVQRLLEELAGGPQHMGYIQGVIPKQWVDFGHFAHDEANRVLAALSLKGAGD